jgi:hypothetical protein
MTSVKDTVSETVRRVAENADADHAIKDNSHKSTTPIAVVPHMAGLIDVNATARARAKNDEAERLRNTTPAFRKP